MKTIITKINKTITKYDAEIFGVLLTSMFMTLFSYVITEMIKVF
jgi:hypothetical protein